MTKLKIINILLDFASEREVLNVIPDEVDEDLDEISYSYTYLFPNKIYAESFYDKVIDVTSFWDNVVFDSETKSVNVGFCIKKEVQND